jgi:hypothetical protein
MAGLNNANPEIERRFKVDFGGEKSLSQLVDLAVSKKKLRFWQRHPTNSYQLTLSETRLPAPLFGLSARMQYGGNGNWCMLEAELKGLENSRLSINEKDFPEFNVNINDYAQLSLMVFGSHHSMLIPKSGLGIFRPRIGVYSLPKIEVNQYIAIQPDAIPHNIGSPQKYTEMGMVGFGQALEGAVNSVYHCAGKPAPEMTLHLQPMTESHM